ncbi:Midasin [Abortiporus biennis]
MLDSLDSLTEFHDPLTINLHRQTKILLGQLPSKYAESLRTVNSRVQLFSLLSGLLATPGLTLTVATAFRPILLDLCSRFLSDYRNKEEKLEALCLLLEFHPEIYPVLLALLKREDLVEGPLAFVTKSDSLAALDPAQLHRILLAYYRILQANRELPQILHWSSTPLSKLIWSSHPDNGVRFLAIRCYALQSRMVEGERVKLEQDIIGGVSEVDCPIHYGYRLDGTSEIVDGWLVPMKEVLRVSNARSAHLEPQNYFVVEDGDSFEPIHPAELSPYIANIHGILMFREPNASLPDSALIATPTAIEALRSLASHISLRVPTLLTSAPSSGKSLILSHLASTLHPAVANQIITIHLADTSLDPRSLLGSYISSTTRPGTFEWKEGVLVRAMREGKWVVFEDIDRGSNEVLGLIKPLVESLAPDNWIGGRASLEVPGKGLIKSEEGFRIFGTRSVKPSRGGFVTPTFFGSHKFLEVVVASPSHDDLRLIIDTRFPKLAGPASEGIIRLWEAVRALGGAASTRDVGLRELDKLCTRVIHVLPSNYQAMDVDFDLDQPTILTVAFPNTTLREDIFFECRDVLFGAGTTTTSAKAHLESIASIAAEHLGLSEERRDWVLTRKVPEFHAEKDVNGNVTSVCLGRTRLVANSSPNKLPATSPRPFAMHKPAVLLMSRIATAISLNEPVLLTGETGTGKTSVVTHLASLLRKPLVSLNLSNQTESSDIIGGFKPVDARVPASELQEKFLDLFGGTFSRKRNASFEESVRKAVQEGKWKRAVGLWKESAKLAKERIQAKGAKDQEQPRGDETPRKRRKTEHGVLNVPETAWDQFERDVRTFEIQHMQGNGKFAFGFVEGPLVKALRTGHWILLDEVNLASAETLECISGLLHGPTASITLTEQGSLEPVKRHPDFRLFACMNPATDVGKKDLPPNIRSRFSEIDVPPPDADKETLLSIVSQYIGPYTVGDKGAIADVAEFYTSVRRLSESRSIADGSNHRPHFSMRTLARALTFAADIARSYSLRRALWEGCLMAFTMTLDKSSADMVTALAQKHILSNVRNPRSLLTKEPTPPQPVENFVKFGPFYLERGPFPEDPGEDYIMTPSVEKKLIDLARIIVTRRFPVLIQGPTSSGKTSSIEYLAKRTGHRFVRINNHEHTDIQEYLGTYVSDANTGKLVFKDGLLVRALRNGDWIVLDELNLAPTDVLEALNRLLDDNRELVIPETQEVVRPHPHFMLFATQNPPGIYAGRKVLSRAFRNRFLEVHFEDVPQAELEVILCERCRIAPSYASKIVSVFEELQRRRQSSRIFESKQGFATLRDLFRWAGRDAIDYQELAENGYTLLAERARRDDDKTIVKEVIESIMKVRIDESRLYNIFQSDRDMTTFLACPPPVGSSLVWTSAMQRLYVLLARALRFNEPVLLVGETGCGKTSVCQAYAEVMGQQLYGVNCHQNTETADLIGGLRPLRNRTSVEAEVIQEAGSLLESLGQKTLPHDIQSISTTTEQALKSANLDDSTRSALKDIRSKLLGLSSMFQWYDGPLIQAMKNGDVFLLDEISLADDSVLERLNSVLEPGRTVVLAERGGDDRELPIVKAEPQFKLVATMNPGGDYGKKELSPALRNRFTEIWVPPVTDRRDLEQIIRSLWKDKDLHIYTGRLLDFTEWLCQRVSDTSIVGLRDILAWVQFSNAVYGSKDLSESSIFHHAAHLTFLDGLASLPQLSSFSRAAIQTLRDESEDKLQEIAPLDSSSSLTPSLDTTHFVQVGSFAIPKGPQESRTDLFSFHAPTTQDNVSRVVRACQLPKPILLEGSPGVGKTSLAAALSNICGYQLCRINLSDQTDLIDLFGSDLPVEGGAPGQFAWKDAEFLRAMQEGHWVLLDEMNLAPQAILEGLNAVLDHRGTVYIPELGRSFSRHPDFRIFAAQNPLSQGGGRKGLPKSFLNRFTKVYVQELSSNDILIVCQNLFPDIPPKVLNTMIGYTWRLNEEAMVKRSFARDGAPWEFNLRDVIRWATLVQSSQDKMNPGQFLRDIFLLRFRTTQDRNFARNIFQEMNPGSSYSLSEPVRYTITSSHIQIGHFHAIRNGLSAMSRTGRVLHEHLCAMEAVGTCLTNGWLTILTGPQNSGKTTLVRLFAHLSGRTLSEVHINHATDASDILGSFEEVDSRSRALHLLRRAINILDNISASVDGSKLHCSFDMSRLRCMVATASTSTEVTQTIQSAIDWMGRLPSSFGTYSEVQELVHELQALLNTPSTGRFEWVDGPLVKAMRRGDWLLLDGANLCNPSVLDRLNSLCELGGVLSLNERGAVDGQVQTITPHENFRLFMSTDSHYGELSRAMRNRGIEVALVAPYEETDLRTVEDYIRLPPSGNLLGADNLRKLFKYELVRRGAIATTRSLPLASFVSNLVGEDSTSNGLLDISPALLTSTSGSLALAYFITHSSSPNMLSLLVRLLNDFPRSFPISSLIAMVQQLLSSPVVESSLQLRNQLVPSVQWPEQLLFNQPLDPNLCRIPMSVINEPDVMVLLLWIRLFVVLHYKDDDLRGAKYLQDDWRSGPRFAKQDEIINSAAHVVQSILEVTRNFYQHVNCSGQGVQDELRLAIRLIQFARYIESTLANDFVDYSAIYAATSWLSETFRVVIDAFHEIHVRVKNMQDLLSFSTGAGIFNIWTAFRGPLLSNNFTERIGALDAAAFGALPSIRSNILQLIAVSTLPSAPTREEVEVIDRLTNQCSNTKAADETVVVAEDPLSIVAEIHVLAGLSLEHDTSELGIKKVDERLNLAVHSTHSRLSRVRSYLQFLWAEKANREKLPILVVLFHGWFSAIWSVPSIAEVDGPSLLIVPSQLYGTNQFLDWNEQTLKDLKSYEETLRRHVSLISLHLGSPQRRNELTDMLALATKMVVAPFTTISSETVAPPADDAANRCIPGLSELLTMLSNIQDPRISDISDRYLLPSLNALEATSKPEDVLGNLGRCWIALSRTLLELFVPEVPIDPEALQRCSDDFWASQRTVFTHQLVMQEDLELRTSGQKTNALIRFLGQALSEIPETTGNPTDSRADISRLHSYWSEIHQFLNHVIPPGKVESFVDLCNVEGERVVLRERVLQESVGAFMHRLDVTYNDFDDVNKPVQLALQFLRFGLRLATHSAVWRRAHPPTISSTASAIIAFPSNQSSDVLLASTGDSNQATFLGLITKLSAIAYEVSIGVQLDCRIQEMEMVYEQALQLWLIDRSREQDAERAGQSLYRQKAVNSEAEVDEEEQEFLSIFPEFEDLLEVESGVTESRKKPVKLADSSLSGRVFRIHEKILIPTSSMIDDSYALFMANREHLLGTVLDNNLASLAEDLDEDSLPFQIRMLHNRFTSLNSSQPSGGIYDFYFDANIPELRKALAVVSSLIERLEVLISEWPDQMVLQHLKSRCDLVLKLTIKTSVAKMLSSLEQLLLHTEDWEMFANRDNSIKIHQQALTNLIVEWRRLELSSWQDLLEIQRLQFEDGVSEWWFRLYELAVRGFLKAVEENEGQGVDQYLDDLVPLVDQFVSSSPIGQYEIRLRLMKSFEVYLGRLTVHKLNACHSPLRRVQNILLATRSYYEQFLPNIISSLSSQRATLEKDIRSFIKLASWKDVNVHALKQSAQKSHRQLYKSIRKFREVLRQPVVDLLCTRNAINDPDTCHGYPESSTPSPIHLSHPITIPKLPGGHTQAAHLQNLERTFKKFEHLVSDALISFISTTSPKSIENLSSEIITTVKFLAASPIPPSVDALKKSKLQKNLLQRKRKAWGDLLKELKRAGYAPNMRPDVLAQHNNLRWIREQGSSMSLSVQIPPLSKAENYLQRLSAILPELRSSLSNHHQDLATRELQRGIMFIESSLDNAFHVRSHVLEACDMLWTLKHTLARLRSSPLISPIVASGDTIVTKVSEVYDTTTRLGCALQELLQTLDELYHLRQSQCPADLRSEVVAAQTSASTLKDKLRVVLSNVKSTSWPLLSQDEEVVVNGALEEFVKIENSLSQLHASYPHLRQLIGPVHIWLSGRQHTLVVRDHVEVEEEEHDHVIDSLLLSVQSLLELRPVDDPPQGDSEAQDRYARDGSQLTCSLTARLALGSLLEELHKTLQYIGTRPHSKAQIIVARFMPFLEQYVQLAEHQVTVQAEWSASLFKLDYVLCSIMKTISKDGFCQPPNAEEEAGGEGGDAVEGSGLGAGTGQENVSKDIQDESQVEGLQGEEDTGEDDDVERAEEGNAVEMAEDFGGKMQDIGEEEQDGEGSEGDNESELDLDEQIGDLDQSENAIDEKLWGDEGGPQDRDKKETQEDHSTQPGEESEMVAKEDETHQDSQGTNSKPEQPETPRDGAEETQADEPMEQEEQEEQEEDPNGAHGAPMDEHIPEADTLDLPDDFNMDADRQESDQHPQEDHDMEGDSDYNDELQDNIPEDEPTDEDADIPNDNQQHAEDDIDTNALPEDEDRDVTLPDVQSGDGCGDTSAKSANAERDNDVQLNNDKASSGMSTGAADPAGEGQNEDQENSQDDEMAVDHDEAANAPEGPANQGDNSTSQRQNVSSTSQIESHRLASNPLRSLGDALKEITRRFDDILSNESEQEQTAMQSSDSTEIPQVEYAPPEEKETMQALGPAGPEEVAKLNELQLSDAQAQPTIDESIVVDDSAVVNGDISSIPPHLPMPSEPTSQALDQDVNGALTSDEVRKHEGIEYTLMDDSVPSSEIVGRDDHIDMSEDVELELRKWQAEGQPSSEAEHIWRLYESITHDLSYSLCEQLRLILEPTMATRLKGDYRTGKRLNMKKIIPYIASEYTKDKIWLRRTRPSQREYQVLIALDDSRSMAESHSVHLAYQTLALVSKALSRLEVGDIAIAKFGEAVEILHGFDEGPFTDQAGTKVMDAFRFSQKATQVLSLVETSLKILEQARERRAMSSATAADLWQMEIIISDGICQDHERLRTVLRRAEEQRVMIVFVVLDSLHTNVSNASASNTAPGQNSILAMNQVAYKEVNGRLDLTVSRYLDTFPFEYYVVVRDVEALPDILSGTLKQFFERISEE